MYSQFDGSIYLSFVLRHAENQRYKSNHLKIYSNKWRTYYKFQVADVPIEYVKQYECLKLLKMHRLHTPRQNLLQYFYSKINWSHQRKNLGLS